MTSFLDAIALDESTHRVASRKAIVLAKHRAEKMFGAFITASGQSALEYLEEDLKGVVQAACDEVGHEDVDGVYAQLLGDFTKTVSPSEPTAKEASVHESRKPKMCQWHKDVVDISLADQNARAGFDAMAQHWGGPRHCEGDGYEGGKCNFKPQMTTQAYWDDKAEKAENRKKLRQDQVEQDAIEQTIPPEAVEVDEVIDIEPSEPVDTPDLGTDAEVIDFPAQDAPEAVSEPMSMAAKTADSGCGRCGEAGAKKGIPCPHCGYEGGTDEDPAFGKDSKTADKDVTGLGGPEPVMDKQKWTPKSVPALEDIDDPDGPHPTKRKDVVEPIKADNSEKLEEIGEQVTEHQDVAKDSSPSAESGGTFQGGPTTAVSSTIPNDVDKNPIVALMQGEYEGFVPHSVVQSAIAAHRRK